MVDLPEEDVLRTLVVVTRHHRKRSSDSNAMAVDVPTTSQVSNLQSFLAVVIDYPASPVSWRNAIRQHLSDVEDLLSVLTVLDDWVAALTGKGSDIDLSLGEVKSVGKGLYAPIPKTRKVMRLRGTTMPSMENVSAFKLSSVALLILSFSLDSSFLASHPRLLISYAPPTSPVAPSAASSIAKSCSTDIIQQWSSASYRPTRTFRKSPNESTCRRQKWKKEGGG